MFIKQLSVFIENREGRLEEVTKVLADGNINIICISLADTSEYGLLRLVVSDPAKAKEILNANGFPAKMTDVIAVRLPHHFGMLNTLTKLIHDSGMNIEYMYALTSGGENASIIIKTSDNEKALQLIQRSNFKLMDAKDAYSL